MSRSIIIVKIEAELTESSEKQELCPSCGRTIYANRPSCMYCGWERQIDSKIRIDMKKALVERTFGKSVDISIDQIEVKSEKQAPAHSGCRQCGKIHSPHDAKFCTGCGAPLEAIGAPESYHLKSTGETTRSASAVEKKHQPAPNSLVADGKISIKKLSSESFNLIRVYNSGLSFDTDNLKQPYNILWILSAMVFLIGLKFPFGIVTVESSGTGSWNIATPGLIIFLFLISFAFMILSNYPVIKTGNPLKAYSTIHASEILVSAVLTREVFMNGSSMLSLIIIFIIIHLAFRKTIRATPEADFWCTVVLSTSLMILLISPHIRTTVLSDTRPGYVDKPGFFIQIAAAALSFSGAVLRGKFHVNRRSYQNI